MAAPDDAAIPEPVRAAWQHAVDGWDDAARHDALLAVVAQHGCYAWAAARYHERDGDAIADARIERLRKAATATMYATASARPDRRTRPYSVTIAMLIGLVTVAIVGFLFAMRLRHGGAPLPPRAATPAGPQAHAR